MERANEWLNRGEWTISFWYQIRQPLTFAATFDDIFRNCLCSCVFWKGTLRSREIASVTERIDRTKENSQLIGQSTLMIKRTEEIAKISWTRKGLRNVQKRNNGFYEWTDEYRCAFLTVWTLPCAKMIAAASIKSFQQRGSYYGQRCVWHFLMNISSCSSSSFSQAQLEFSSDVLLCENYFTLQIQILFKHVLLTVMLSNLDHS